MWDFQEWEKGPDLESKQPFRFSFVFLGMNTAERKLRHAFEEYLALEDQAEYKNEYYNGEILGMSGGTDMHSLIGNNINAELRSALWDKDCFAFGSDLKIWIEAGEAGVYPDGMVICNPKEYYKNRPNVDTNPVAVIEVLSDSTAAWDRGGKFRQYQRLASLEEYVLVEQKVAQIDIFRKNAQGFWVLEGYEGLNSQIVFKSLGVSIPIRGVYHGVEFGDGSE